MPSSLVSLSTIFYKGTLLPGNKSFVDYSFLRASMGFMRDAFLAG